MSDLMDMGGHRERERQLTREVALWIRIRDLEADRDAWKAKYEAAIEALSPFSDLSGEGDEDFPDKTPVVIRFGRTTAYGVRLGDLRRAASLVSDHDRAKEASDAG